MLISGNSDPKPPLSKVSFAVFSAFLEAVSPCRIFVASLANKIFRLFMFFSLSKIFLISLISISVKKFINFLTSRSSVFLQNCQ